MFAIRLKRDMLQIYVHTVFKSINLVSNGNVASRSANELVKIKLIK